MTNALSDANLTPTLYEAVWRELPRAGGSSTGNGGSETVLWAGQPDARRITTSALPILLFGIPWTLFSLVWMGLAAQASGLFATFGLPFVVIGGVMLAAPWLAGKRARQTVYVLTNCRILFITTGSKGTEVKTYVPRDPSDIERNERANGSGDLVFFRRETRDSDGDRSVEEIGFIGIPDVRVVERLLTDTFFAPHSEGDAPPSGAAPWYSTYRGEA